MPEVTKHDPGRFCWIELATTDPEAAKRFYGDLFDWSAEDRPAGEGMLYTMLRLHGKEVGGLYRLDDQRRQAGVPPHWFTYVLVKSADESAKKAASLGGTVVQEAFDVMDVGRMAVIQDPTGAHLPCGSRGVIKAPRSRENPDPISGRSFSPTIRKRRETSTPSSSAGIGKKCR